jgi:hypothetical protein
VRYRFAVYELRPNRPRRWLGDVAARAWPSQVGNTRFVGPGSTFPDIATAVTASSHGDRIVAAAGTYAAFTLTKALLIVPDGSGPVVIDTTFGKLLVMNIPAGLDVALYGLTIGGASPQGMEVNNCQGVVVLDDSTVTVGSMQTALRVTDSQQVALQKVVLQTGNGGVALDLVAGPVNGSVVFAGNCTLPSLQIDATSRLVHAGTASGVPAHARATALAGTAPRLEAPLTMSGFQQDSFDIAADPFDFWALLLGGPKTFLDLSPALPVDMVLLLNPGFAFTAASGLVPPGGLVQLPVTMPDLPAGWGSAVGFQAVVLRTANNSFRLANVRDVVFVP